MYNNKSLEYKKQSDKNTQTSELTLSHKYGYKFEFKSNGLSQQDKLEIAKALENITPNIDELINNKNQNKQNEKFQESSHDIHRHHRRSHVCNIMPQQ